MSWHTCTGPAFIFVTALFNHLCCLLHLQQTREVVMVVTIAPDKQARTNQQSRWKRTSAACRYLTQGCFCVDTLHSISIFFVNFIHPSSWLFPHIGSEKVCTLIKHSVTKFSVISSGQYTLSFITSFFEEMFFQSRNFYENKLIWYYGIIRSRQKWSGKCMVYGLMDKIPRTKTKTLPLWK